jgi:hypothetical protein
MTNICIITSGIENLNIVNLCQKLSISHTIIVDSLFWPYQDKDTIQKTQRTEDIISYMKSQWITHFICHPTIELALLENNKNRTDIIPLFTNYINYCLNHSLIGKIWFVWWYSDLNQIESIFENIKQHYKTTDNQKNIKKFKLSKRTKDTSMRWYFPRLFSPRQMMVNKIITTDLRYFKDANIDTIIPLDYSYFNFQKTITSFFNQKKQKFHKRDILENIFKNIIQQNNTLITNNIQLITVYYTWSLHLIQDNKKWKRLLSQWQQKNIEYKNITI